MASDEEIRENLTSGGLIMYDAVSFYELLCQSEPDITSIQRLKNQKGTWKQAFTEAFKKGVQKKYTNIFSPALGVISILPTAPDVENSLENIYDASQYVVSRAGLLKQDLSGRIYHSALGQATAKRFATFYTRIPSSELLASLAIEDWDDKIIDFACGSGTLINSGYSRKLSLALPSAIEEHNGIESLDGIHKKFLSEDIYGMDAMAFAAHFTTVNLATQRSSTQVGDSNVYQTPVTNPANGESRTGSLELLSSNTIPVQERFDDTSIGAEQAVSSETVQTTIDKDFDVVIMNPPFTEKSRATKILNMSKVNSMAREHNDELTGQTGLAAPFVQLAHLHLKEGGRMAMVLPTAVLDRYSWRPVREMLKDNYNIEHIVTSYAPNMPAWSENTDRREVLLVARKQTEGDNPRTKQPIISHVDKDIDFTEAREIARVLKNTDPKSISLNSPNSQILFTGAESQGEAFSIPSGYLSNNTANWYKFSAYRDPKIIKLMAYLQGIYNTSNAPYNMPVSDYTSQLRQFADVKLFLKNIKTAGYRVVDDQPSRNSDWTVNTSTINKINLKEQDVEWVYKDLH